jgi:hypothetical protein
MHYLINIPAPPPCALLFKRHCAPPAQRQHQAQGQQAALPDQPPHSTTLHPEQLLFHNALAPHLHSASTRLRASRVHYLINIPAPPPEKLPCKLFSTSPAQRQYKAQGQQDALPDQYPRSTTQKAAFQTTQQRTCTAPAPGSGPAGCAVPR